MNNIIDYSTVLAGFLEKYFVNFCNNVSKFIKVFKNYAVIQKCRIVHL